MDALIQGATVNVAVFDGDHVDVISITPSFKVTAGFDDYDRHKSWLDSDFRDMFCDKLLCTESFQDQFPTVLVREVAVPMVKSEEGVDCIRCSIADAWFQKTGVPCIVDYAPVTLNRCEEFQAYAKYKAVVIDMFGYVYSFFGTARTPFNTVFHSNSTLTFKEGNVELPYGLHPIESPLSKAELISNLGSWYKI